MDYTQAQQELLAHQEMTHPASVVGTPIDVSTQLAGLVYTWQANIETTANLAAGLDYIDIQISPDASGNNWVSYLKLAPSTTASESEALTSATEAVGATLLELASTTNLDASDFIYIKDATSVAESEWAQIISIVANTSITVADGLASAKASGDVVYDQACRWSVFVDLCGVMRLRIVVVHQGATGSDWRIKAVFETATDIE